MDASEVFEVANKVIRAEDDYRMAREALVAAQDTFEQCEKDEAYCKTLLEATLEQWDAVRLSMLGQFTTEPVVDHKTIYSHKHLLVGDLVSSLVLEAGAEPGSALADFCYDGLNDVFVFDPPIPVVLADELGFTVLVRGQPLLIAWSEIDEAECELP